MFNLIIICNVPEVYMSGGTEHVTESLLHSIGVNCDKVGVKLNVVDVIESYNANSWRVISALKTMAQLLSRPGNRGLIYYNGHGGQVRDTSGDESDGKDEMWCLMGGGNILDDEISTIFNNISDESALCLISDSCSSGTMIDAKLNHKPWVTLSSCKDSEDSLCTCDGGVFTLFGLIPAIQNHNGKLIEISKDIEKRLSIPGQHLELRTSRTDLPYINFFDVTKPIVAPNHSKYCAL